MMIWAPLFVFLLQISTVGGTNQYHLAVMLRKLHNIGERGGSVVECWTPEREVRGSKPTAAVLCP